MELRSVSDVSPSVPCNQAHELEVYAVSTVDPSLTARKIRPGQEMLRGRSTSSCPREEIRPYLGARTNDFQWGIELFVKFPTTQEWEQGGRRVACELASFSGQSDKEDPVVYTSLRGIMRRADSARVRLCRSGTRAVTCDGQHTAEKVGEVTAKGAAAQLAQCRRLASEYTGRPLRSDFEVAVADLTAPAECWYGPRVGLVRGTVRGGLR